jgi:hypothetical protein
LVVPVLRVLIPVKHQAEAIIEPPLNPALTAWSTARVGPIIIVRLAVSRRVFVFHRTLFPNTKDEAGAGKRVETDYPLLGVSMSAGDQSSLNYKYTPILSACPANSGISFLTPRR